VLTVTFLAWLSTPLLIPTSVGNVLQMEPPNYQPLLAKDIPVVPLGEAGAVGAFF
jgi:hypothetical protein